MGEDKALLPFGECSTLTQYQYNKLSKIFDNVPQDTDYPYVVIGNERAVNRGTKTLDGNDYNIDITP